MKRAIVFVHKWLGITLALLFLMWFVTGLVLYYVPFPNLTQAERRAGLQPLTLKAGCCLTAEEAARVSGVAFSEARLGMGPEPDAVPVWRLLVDSGKGTPPRWTAIDAATGTTLAPLTAAQAMKTAGTFSGRTALSAEAMARDQWTVPQGLNPYRPLFKVRLDGDDGLELYVSTTAAEVVRDTRRAERFWNWVGSVPHWIYPTVLRQFPQAWNQVVVWLAIPGVVLAATGSILGIWQLFLNGSRWIPYRKRWMRWHHIAGLIASVFTLTWIFSGLMSMNPYGVFAPRGLPAEEQARWLGVDNDARLMPQAAMAAVTAAADAAPEAAIREVERIRIDGQMWYHLQGVTRHWWVHADKSDGVPAVEAVLPEALVIGALRRLHGDDQAPTDIARISRYDDVYYTKDASAPDALDTRPLPVWRARWPDGVDVYADAGSGRVLLRITSSGRWQRLLYPGLHSLDFAPIRERPWLRETLVLMLSSLGIALCVTACVLGWRALAPPRTAVKARKP